MKGLGKRTILLVEDDPRLRDTLWRYLADQDFHVETAVEYHAAVAALEQRTPTLVCLELALPRESGYELCEYIRGPLGMSNVPILAMSDRGSPEDMAYAEQVGANAYVKKPFTRRHLASCIATMLEGADRRPSVRLLAL